MSNKGLREAFVEGGIFLVDPSLRFAVEGKLRIEAEKRYPTEKCGACDGTGMRLDEAGEYVCTLCEGTGKYPVPFAVKGATE